MPKTAFPLLHLATLKNRVDHLSKLLEKNADEINCKAKKDFVTLYLAAK